MDYGRMSFWTLNFYHMSLPTADNLKLRCPAVSVATISNTLQCVLLDASSRKMFSPSYTVTCVFLLISFINTLHRYSNIYHRYRILCGIPSVYLLYSWKFPSAGLKVLPKKGTTSLFTSTCLPIKDWLSSPKNQSVGGEMCSALLPHMLGGSVIKSFLFCESHIYICLIFIPWEPACPPGSVACFRWQVATIFLLTVTFISDYTDNRPEVHSKGFLVFSLSFCGLSPSLFSLHILPSSCCLLLLLWCCWPCCPSFTHIPWDLLLPFHIHYNFNSPSPKALLLHSFTTHSYPTSCFITLQSFHLFHLEPHAPSLDSSVHLLSVSFFGFSHQILISCLIHIPCLITSACFFSCCISSPVPVSLWTLHIPLHPPLSLS